MKSRIAVLLSFNSATDIDSDGGWVFTASVEHGMTLHRVATSVSIVDIGSDLMHVIETELCIRSGCFIRVRCHQVVARQWGIRPTDLERGSEYM